MFRNLEIVKVFKVRIFTLFIFTLLILSPSFLFALLLLFLIRIFVQISLKLFNIFDFLINQKVMKPGIDTKKHLIHDMSELTVPVLLKPRILTYDEASFSLYAIPTLSKHVLFLLLCFFF